MKLTITMTWLGAVAVLVAGCGGGSPNCATVSVLRAGPATATADSKAAAPGNQVKFQASSDVRPVDPKAACALPALSVLVNAAWTSSDAVHVSISSAADETNGLAVCNGPTAGAVTLTATTGSGAMAETATAQLTCH